jgi:hypothetical protein
MKQGDSVIYIGGRHEECPTYFPPNGTIGTIDGIYDEETYWVKWPEGTTNDSIDSVWAVCTPSIVPDTVENRAKYCEEDKPE